MARPTPIARCTGLAASAPAIEPAPNTAKTNPTSSDDMCSVRTR